MASSSKKPFGKKSVPSGPQVNSIKRFRDVVFDPENFVIEKSPNQNPNGTVLFLRNKDKSPMIYSLPALTSVYGVSELNGNHNVTLAFHALEGDSKLGTAQRETMEKFEEMRTMIGGMLFNNKTNLSLPLGKRSTVESVTKMVKTVIAEPRDDPEGKYATVPESIKLTIDLISPKRGGDGKNFLGFKRIGKDGPGLSDFTMEFTDDVSKENHVVTRDSIKDLLHTKVIIAPIIELRFIFIGTQQTTFSFRLIGGIRCMKNYVPRQLVPTVDLKNMDLDGDDEDEDDEDGDVALDDAVEVDNGEELMDD
ncbi:hypothetical protein M427DRAFT_50282 [Gonapodya prolifera JEL478]|uniref:Uncharacterized protein n=1 Tax=Gonapodya prolifera (strain JEL478) TaxID=1344416 RepID=A0A138ZWF2_GONPJ|nr:hypothetical protein M427DRAFT_50282 [Gonapodya prolifera JEL478]|eukprot:KXS08826.1 hypothetical protein M427DRAFT_50282 [Gonapodya prolifera JEL478]